MAKYNRNDLKVNDNVLKLADSLSTQLQIGEGGVVTVNKDFYENNLPDGLTMADVKRVQEHNGNVLAGAQLALGETGIEYFRKHKDVDQLTLEIKAGADKMGVGFQRTRTYPGMKGGPEKTTVGVSMARYTAQAAGNVGSMKKVRTHLSQQAASLLG